jgi:hypothetical protein
MGQKFKLRFGDGTTLALDHDGLRTWVDAGKVDAQTAVQPPGQKVWQPLHDFLAGQKQARGGGPPPEPGALRLAPIADEPAPDEELYEGEYGEPEGPLALAWLWAKRLAMALVVLMGLGSAVAWWPVWVPWARDHALPWITENGVRLFTAIDHRVHPERAVAPPSADAERARRIAEARDTAAAELPQLDGSTIERVMAASLMDVVEPPEVFSRAHEAIARGLPSLAADEAAEARTLKAKLIAAAPGPERERLREYDRTRAHRSTLPFEDREAMKLTARAFRALPEPDRQRLQALWAKAAAGGLSR